MLDSKEALTEALQGAIERLRSKPNSLRVPFSDDAFNPEHQGHFHLYPKLFIPISGTTHFDCPDQSFDLKPGQLCLMPSGVSHCEQAKPSSEPTYSIVIAFANVSKQLLVFHATKRPSGNDIHAQRIGTYRLDTWEQCIQLINWSQQAFLDKGTSWQTATANLLETAFIQIIEALAHPAEFGHKNSPAVSQSLRLIASQLNNYRLSVSSLAQELNISAGHLSRIFAAEMGIKLGEYIISQRIQTAKELLKEGKLDVNEVAYACGYKYPPYFVRAFKQHVGITPGKWNRQTQRANAQTSKRSSS